jgi:hypothetical protein
MNFLVTGKRPVLLAFFLIVTLAGFSRWNSSTSNGNSKDIPSPKYPKPSNQSPYAGIPRTAGTPAVGAKLLAQATSEPLTATADLIDLALTPTLSATAQVVSETASAVASVPSLEEFAQQVSDGQGDRVRGIYVARVMALRVVPQPQGDPGFISAEDGTATLFQTAALFGVTGLLAHNFLSGKEFFRLNPGQQLNVIYGDGHIRHYRVSQVDDFQRLSITDLRSNFMELSSGLEKTADQVFADFYQGGPHLTLQTCIERNGEWSWGVRFIRADPTE